MAAVGMMNPIFVKVVIRSLRGLLSQELHSHTGASSAC